MGLLKDKVILITGAGRGIGRDFALACAKHGAKVVVNDYGANAKGTDIEGSPASDVVNEVEAMGGCALADNSDVSNFSSVEEMFENISKISEKLMRLLIMLILRDKIFHKMSLDDWKAVIDVHLNGSFYVSRIAADHFRQQEKGAFVHMTSTSGLVGNFGQANYLPQN